MKTILLSAYACEPTKGSEPGVGWAWATGLATAGYDVWVITRANNQRCIDEALRRRQTSNLHFVFYDLPGWALRWKRGHIGVYLYCLLWQVGVFWVARRLCRTVTFECVHHVTLVSARIPSFLGLLGKPFIFGPIAGGEKVPLNLRGSLPVAARFHELCRDVANLWIRIDPLMNLTFHTAAVIIVTSEYTLRLVAKKHHTKVSVNLAVGVEAPTDNAPPVVTTKSMTLRLLYVGELRNLKGVHLLLKALAQLKCDCPEWHLTIVGDGPAKRELEALARSLKIDRAITWVPWMQRADLWNIYASHDLFVFPSLRDSGGMVVLEAMSRGLPVICLDLGGPAAIVDQSCGIKILTGRMREVQVIAAIANGVEALARDSALRIRLSTGARARAAEYDWQKVIRRIYAKSRVDRLLRHVQTSRNTGYAEQER